MKTGFKKYDSSYKRKESPFTRVGGMGISNIPSQNLIDDQKDRSVLPPSKRKNKKNKRGPFKSKELLNEVSSQLKAASKKHAGQADKIDKATSAMKLAKPQGYKPPKKFKQSKTKIKYPQKKFKEKTSVQRKKRSNPFMKRVSATGRKKLERTIFPFDSHERVDYHGLGAKGANKRKIKIRKAKDVRSDSAPSAPLKKISGPCKAAAKRKFKVWPSAYASGWGVRCTKAGGPSKFGG